MMLKARVLLHNAIAGGQMVDVQASVYEARIIAAERQLAAERGAVMQKAQGSKRDLRAMLTTAIAAGKISPTDARYGKRVYTAWGLRDG